MVTRHIILIGAGGIGSHCAFLLGRLRDEKKLTIYDPDLVEVHNIDNQVYFSWDAGKPKVVALSWYFYGLPHAGEVIFKQERVDENTELSGIVIAAVDNLETRLLLCRTISPANPKGNYVPLLIAPGAAENFGFIYVLDPNDPDQLREYEEIYTRKDGAETAPQPCVDPELGPVFAGCIIKIIKKFWQGWRPLKLTRIEIDFGHLTEIRIREI